MLRGIEELREFLLKYNIQKGEFCLIGGCCLAALDIRPNNDLDILVSEDKFNHIREANQDKCIWQECEMINIGNIDIKRNYYLPIGVGDDIILNNTEFHVVHKGFKIIRPELVFATKTIRHAGHDNRDISLLEKKIKEKNITWNWDMVRNALLFKQNSHEQKISEIKNKSTSTSINYSSYNGRIKKILLMFLREPGYALKFSVKKIQRKLHLSINKDVAVNKIENPEKTTELVPDKQLEAQIVNLIPTSALLHLQLYNGKFNRYDILLRYLALRALVSNRPDEKKRYLHFYWDMQEKRIGQENAKSYSEEGMLELFSSIKEHGFNKRYPIPISTEGILIDGAHRLAIALLEKVEYVPVSFLPGKQRIDFGREWFVINNFPESLLQEMDELLEKLFWQNGVYFVAIIWPPAFDYAPEIQDDIENEFRIMKSFNIEIQEDHFPEFVKEVYAIDDIGQWKIEVKISAMVPYPKHLRIIYFEMQEPEFRIKVSPRAYLAEKGERLKKKIREKYKERIPDYFYDIIFHTGDNHEHNSAITRTITKYRQQAPEFINQNNI